MSEHNASLVFLASNAKPEEVLELEAALRGAPLVRFEPLAPPLAAAGDNAAPPQYTSAELAVIDTLICALADAFIGTRRSMFSWNILEERVLQGRDASTGTLMGLGIRAGRRRALTKAGAAKVGA